MSPPPLGPQPHRYGNPAILELYAVLHYLQKNEFDRNVVIPNGQGQRRDREASDPNEEDIHGTLAEGEREEQLRPAERVHTDTFQSPLFEETDEGNASEATVATTEEQSQLSVTPKRDCRSPSAEVSIPRKEGPQNEAGSQSPSTPGYSEDSSSLVEPPVSQATSTASDGQISDCYRCERPNSSENIVAYESNHGSHERWFHVSCAGLTMVTVPLGVGKRNFLIEHLRNTKYIIFREVAVRRLLNVRRS